MKKKSNHFRSALTHFTITSQRCEIQNKNKTARF